MLINMMKCGKCKQWFHGGMMGWICPYCNPQNLKDNMNHEEETLKYNRLVNSG